MHLLPGGAEDPSLRRGQVTAGAGSSPTRKSPDDSSDSS